ncbi:MAG: hypothetical protein V4540_04245 [Pseudomonadota bacterium]
MHAHQRRVAGAAILPQPGAAAAGLRPQEQARIDRLIPFVDARNDMNSISNGTGYGGARAARLARDESERMEGRPGPG